MEEFKRKLKELDTSYEDEHSRYRINLHFQLGLHRRHYPPDPARRSRTLEEPRACRPRSRNSPNWNAGLVLVTGPTGCGKSTTLAAMINLINQNRACHIITIEDPIEFVHTPKLAHHRPARGRLRHRFVRERSKRVLRQDPRRDPGRRNARPGNDPDGDHRRRDRPPGDLHPAHPGRRPDDRPHHRRLSRRTSRSRSGPSCR